MFPETNSEKIAKSNHGIFLYSHHYRQARDLCKPIDDHIIKSTKVVDAKVCSVHKRDLLTVMCTGYGELIKLNSTQRNNGKPFPNLCFVSNLSSPALFLYPLTQLSLI